MKMSVYTYRNKFSKDQISEFQSAFILLERSNGCIHTHDFRKLLATIGYNPADKVLEELYLSIENGKKQLNFDEFMELIAQLETDDKNTKEAKDAFNAFDFEGNGYIPAFDIKEALMCVLKTAKDSEREAIIKFFKLETNRKVYFNEFKAMITYSP
ncbi:calmodulin, striated muscle isoform X1 [Hydra vulgaris]|uniref:calmodulin, striated muscle isoform X1 n=1 Tax=Hydra vulgaris TaxID=6087 RepID=UPI001F5F0330|nr:calmodulin, striated muscle [Hydra vulgaris]